MNRIDLFQELSIIDIDNMDYKTLDFALAYGFAEKYDSSLDLFKEYDAASTNDFNAIKSTNGPLYVILNTGYSYTPVINERLEFVGNLD